MSPDTAITIVIAMSAVMGTLAAWLGWRETHRDNIHARDTSKIKAIIHTEIKSLTDKVQELHNKLNNIEHEHEQARSDIHELTERMGRVLDRLAVIETKIEVFWRSVAMDAAKIIHSPDPRREHIDRLLESFRNETLTSAQKNELRNVLHIIVDNKPGQDVGFPIHPGEKFAASVLLHSMELSEGLGERNA